MIGRARADDQLGDGEDAGSRDQARDSADENTCTGSRYTGEVREHPLGPREQREERVVAQRPPVRHRADESVAVFGDAGVPLCVPLGQHRVRTATDSIGAGCEAQQDESADCGKAHERDQHVTPGHPDGAPQVRTERQGHSEITAAGRGTTRTAVVDHGRMSEPDRDSDGLELDVLDDLTDDAGMRRRRASFRQSASMTCLASARSHPVSARYCLMAPILLPCWTSSHT